MLANLPLPISVTPRSLVLGPRGYQEAMGKLRAISWFFQIGIQSTINGFTRIATLPYYRLYHFNTIDPLQKIAALASQPSPDVKKLLRTVALWRARKLSELQFIIIACTVLAAAVIGAFSWTTMEEAYWLTHGFWHSSLILSILGILLSASEITVLDLLGPLCPTRKLVDNEEAFERYKPLLLSRKGIGGRLYVPRRKMVFTWQGPLMFMSYSVSAFLAGLTILVCTPFIRNGGNWSVGHSVAIMYLTVLVGGMTAFVFCSYWVYHYVDLTFDVHGEEAQDPQERDLEEFNAAGFRNMLVPFVASDTAAATPYRQPFDMSERSDSVKQVPYRKGSV